MKTAVKILLVAAAAWLGIASPASAFHWWRNAEGNVVHVTKPRNPAISMYNKTTNGSGTAVEHARGEWSARSSAADVGNWASDSADVVVWDNYWGDTGWRGQVTPYGLRADGKVTQMGAQLNLSELPNYIQQRKTACHELGHAVAGVDHDDSRSGCMFAGPARSNLQERLPSAHDVDHMNVLWGQMDH